MWLYGAYWNGIIPWVGQARQLPQTRVSSIPAPSVAPWSKALPGRKERGMMMRVLPTLSMSLSFRSLTHVTVRWFGTGDATVAHHSSDGYRPDASLIAWKARYRSKDTAIRSA